MRAFGRWMKQGRARWTRHAEAPIYVITAAWIAGFSLGCEPTIVSSPADGSQEEIADAATDADAALPLANIYAFVGSSDGQIHVYDVDETTGAWTAKMASAAGTAPNFLAFDPSRRRVVAVNETASAVIRSFSFDPDTGALTEIGSARASGTGSTHVSLSPDGAWAFASNYGGDNTYVFSLSPAGVLATASDIEASGDKSHWAGTDPSGMHVYVCVLGVNVVARFTFDTATGALTANGTVAMPAGAGPRHLAFHPTKNWAYVINEVDITVSKLDFNPATGALTLDQTVSAIPNLGAGTRSGAEIAVHPSGKWVYASTRTDYNSIAHFNIDATTGDLTRVANHLTGGNRPRSFGIDPDGKFLYAGNQNINQVVGFRIDQTTGVLTSLGEISQVQGPAFVGLARIP